MSVNGIEIVTQWDLDRSVRDGKGRDVLGVTEADPALPGVLLISLNAELIAERDYLKRSTLAHELGHALFDGPSMLRQAGQPAFAMVTPDEEHLVKPGCKPMDWREFRANEFMGALLAPRALLHRELVRRAIALRLPLRDTGENQPVLRAAGDPIRIEELLFDLAERFGVSASFIEYRLHRYALVQ
jgi:Zn-dependent peptidase ImmA (M78 family)